jgi:hypothetical protein
MRALVFAEVRYHLPQIALLAALAIGAAVSPHAIGALVGDAPGANVAPARLAATVALTAYLWWYGLTLIGVWNVLASERSERRLVLYRTLPLGRWRLAAARQLRIAALPVLWGTVGLAALAVSAWVRGDEVAFPAAIVGLMTVAATLGGILVSTLDDLGGPRLVQAVLVCVGVASVTTIAVAPGALAALAAALGSFGAGVTGVAAAVVVGALVVGGNLVLQVVRPTEPA